MLNEQPLTAQNQSAIFQHKSTIEMVPAVLDTVTRVAKQIDTVIAIGVSTRCAENGEDPVLAPLLDDLGHTFVRAKTNMGLGRITNIQAKESVSDQHAASVR
jgi:hypothetical protein